MPRDYDASAQGEITAILGPTNTGKTHYAIERMLSRADGVIGLPLRLLAREVYDKIVAVRGPGAVALITGEEKIAPATAKYFVCTVEAMPLDRGADFVAIDEIQLCADPERGHVFTDRLLHARGRYETLFMGSDTIRPRIASLVPKARFVHRDRYSTLSYTGSRKLSRLKPRTAVVAFSIDQVYGIAELIRRQRGGAAVVMGALSPRTRNAQVQLYQDGHVDYLVATDAIGMGLNLDIDHVAFAGTTKFDGWRHRPLGANELAQIAGRAGRYQASGSFGVTGEAGPMDPEVIDAIESHRFKPLTRLYWRNSDLPFSTVPRLIAALEVRPERTDLVRGRDADDLMALKTLWDDPAVAALAGTGDRVRRLWDVCQTPDFRNTLSSDHVTLLSRIYRFLVGGSGVIPSDWIAAQVGRLDRVDGDIDTLSKRLAYIRTWTYVANRAGWVEDAENWRGVTRDVEDRLSDALHERLTQRFVDRRTSVLMRRLKQKERLVADVNDKGEVTVEGEFVGRLSGFRFTPDETAGDDEAKRLRSTSLGALETEFARRADKLYLSPDTEIDVTEQGGLMWGADAVGRLERGSDPLTPAVKVFVDELADTGVAEKVSRRLTHWVGRRINALFEPLVQMRDDEAVTGLAKGVAFQLTEAMGIVPRRQISADVKALGQDERALLRKHGVRFGQHNIFLPVMLKPAPTRMRLLLWSLWEAFEDFPPSPPAGHVTIAPIAGAPKGYYEKAGFRLCGARAVRIDMLERLSDLIRPMDVKGGFEATPDMLSITGATLDQLAEILKGLGFDAARAERPKAAKAVAPEAQATPEGDRPKATAESAAAEVETAPVAEPVAEAATDASSEGEAADLEPASQAEATPETVPEKAEAAPDGKPPEATEESAAAEVETAPVAEPVADAATDTCSEGEVTEAEAPAEAVAEGDVTAETAETARTETDAEAEVYYVFTLRPRQGGRGRSGPPRDRAEAGQPARPKGKGKHKGPKGGGKDGAPGRDGPRSDGPRADGPRLPQKPRRDRPVDPDSPFAILQQLKK